MNRLSRRTLLQAFGAACVLAAVPVFAKDNDWDEIGDAEFGPKLDDQDIVVSAAKGKFRTIKLKADNADARVEEITIELANGDKIEKKIRDAIKEGKETRPIALKVQRDVAIRKITIKARSTEVGKQTKIEVYGNT